MKIYSLFIGLPLIFSLNVFAIKNSMFNLTDEIVTLIINTKDLSFRNFFEKIKSPGDFQSVSNNIKMYPEAISDYIFIIQKNIAYSLIEAVGLTFMKEQVERGKITNDEYMKEYKNRFYNMLEDKFRNIYENAILEALNVIRNCFKVIIKFSKDDLQTVVIDNNILKDIGGEFEIDFYNAIQKSARECQEK